MKRTFPAAIMMCITLAMTGCGDGGHNAPLIVTDILSAPALDGDIVQNPPGVFTVTQGMSLSPTIIQSVFAGIDPAAPGAEYRAFLDFPLRETGGVPRNAIIELATLDIFINSIQPLTGTIPILIDLVDFQPPTLLETDFFNSSLPARATISLLIFQADSGNHVFIDVTSLMRKAQSLGLPNFQIRILLDPTAAPGRIEINDTTGVNRGVLAPLLQVKYF